MKFVGLVARSLVGCALVIPSLSLALESKPLRAMEQWEEAVTGASSPGGPVDAKLLSVFEAAVRARKGLSQVPAGRIQDSVDAIVGTESKGMTPSYMLQVSPSTHDFGVIPQGSEATQTFTFTNTGDAQVTFSSQYPNAGSTLLPDPFSHRNSTCGGTLAPSASCSIEVAFAPQQAGSASGYVFARINESTSLFYAPLSGSDGTTATYEIDISPSAHDFGVVPQGTESTQAFTLTNTGDAMVTFGAQYPFAGSTLIPDPYSDRNSTCGDTLVPGAWCTIEVVFAPQQADTANGYLFVRINESTSLFYATLSGTDGTLATYEVGISPAPHDFGTVPQGSEASQAFTITNTGDAAVTFQSSYPFAGSTLNPDPYSERNSTCASMLSPAEWCNIEVVFAPQQAGSADGYLFVRINQSTRLFFTALTGSSGATITSGIFAHGFEVSGLQRD